MIYNAELSLCIYGIKFAQIWVENVKRWLFSTLLVQFGEI